MAVCSGKLKDVVVHYGGLPIKTWLTDIEEGALAQAINLSKLPFAFKHIALMPDCHQGYGMPIGGVMATKGVVVPNAVGVDIGCGMIACKTNIGSITTEELKKVLGGSKERQGGIRTFIPTGFSHHSSKELDESMPEVRPYNMKIVDEEYQSARKQLGTLGGGNHFIEIQMGSDRRVWVMIHSGSRNIGLKVARHYNDLAKSMHKKWHTKVDPAHDLAFFPLDSNEGIDYLNEMQYCLEFASASRWLMMQRCKKAFNDVFNGGIHFDEPIESTHNFVAMEQHFKQNVMVHRKGATRARVGEKAIIPGSQGTASYIVEGQGNPQSFFSCSHGAGRKMGRKAAQRDLNLEEEINKLEEQGILHGIRGKKQLDEASGAYKDIEQVMRNQDDLVEVLVKLRPLAVVKG